MSREYYIVEHPSRGVVIDGPDIQGKFRCSYTAKRTEGTHYQDVEIAKKVSAKIPKSYVLLVSWPFNITFLDGRRA